MTDLDSIQARYAAMRKAGSPVHGDVADLLDIAAELRGQVTRVEALCDWQDRHDPSSGHWVSTSLVRAAIAGATMPTEGVAS